MPIRIYLYLSFRPTYLYASIYIRPQVLELQQMQMQMMAKQNENILDEVASLRATRPKDETPPATMPPSP